MIDFEPKRSVNRINDFHNTYKIGGLPELKSIEMYSFFENREKDHVIMSKVKKSGVFLLDHRIFKKIDLKIDDGIINTGIFRAACNGYDRKYANKCNWIEYQILKKL